MGSAGRDADATVATASPGAPATRNHCLEVDVLVAMADGTLPETETDGVLAHVDRCVACAELIANLGALDAAGRRVGRYEIERVLGVGGMGIVYAAFDPQLQRRVAVKLVRPENTTERAQSLMVAEARSLARVSHPNVVTVHDAGEHDGEIYVATELVDGTTLFEWQAHHRAVREIVDVWVQVARGLAAAHAMGVVHRDVKPANVLVGRDGRVRIGDFGIAHRDPAATDVSSRSPRLPSAPPDVIAGTPAYMAPEHRAGRVDARSDQYSAAVSIVEALTGKRPTEDDVISLEPPALAAVLTRALRANPDERLPTMTDFADALAAAIAPPPPPAPKRSRRRIALAVAGAVSAAVAITAVAVPALRPASSACTVVPVPDTVTARRDRLAHRLPANISPYVDHWLAGWANASGDVCASRDRELRASRRACLDKTLAALDQLLASWEAKPPGDALSLFIALDQLPHAAWCSEPALVDSPYPTPAQRDAIAAIEHDLASASSIAAIEQLRARARAIGDPTLVTKLAIAVAERQAQTDRPLAARTLRDAIASAHGFSSVLAMIALIHVLEPDPDHVAEAETVAAAARAKLSALGGDPALESELDAQLGSLLKTAGRHVDAIPVLERARQTARIAHGASSPQEANALVALAGALFVRDGTVVSPAARAAGKAADEIWERNGIAMPSVVPAETAAELLTQVERMRAMVVAQSGPESEDAFEADCNLSDAHTMAEQPARALEYAKRAVELAPRIHVRNVRLAYIQGQASYLAGELDHGDEALAYARDAVATATALQADGELASALTALGRAEVRFGKAAAAREPLQRALALRIRLNERAHLRGVTRFWLAAALWDVDRKRARDQATMAREEIQSYLDTNHDDNAAPFTVAHQHRYLQSVLDKIDRWQRDHAR
ncbi:MAG TPA: serine/threonine-protein kinase [Kofleriaceae bacterium]|nr:serine/threonine-protein kinase [Kofleriaceae bacterium]